MSDFVAGFLAGLLAMLIPCWCISMAMVLTLNRVRKVYDAAPQDSYTVSYVSYVTGEEEPDAG